PPSQSADRWALQRSQIRTRSNLNRRRHMNSWFRGSTRAVIAGFALLLPLAFAAVASAVMPCVLVPSGPMTLTLAADCTTDTTILIPNGFTLDGNGNTITAVDPAGDHFRGAVVKNGRTTATSTNSGTTAFELAAGP